jgi:type I restriction enzyme S subunit
MDEGLGMTGLRGAVAVHGNSGDWNIMPLLALVVQRKEFRRPDLPLLGVSLDTGVRVRWSDDGRPAASIDLAGYKVVRSGDIIMNALGKPHGSVGRSANLGVTSPAYWVMKPTEHCDSRYLHHVLRSRHMINEYQRLGKNQPPNQFDLTWGDFRRIEIVVPPLRDQARIADFLDDQVARIDNIITARRNQIGLVLEHEARKLDDLMAYDAVPSARLGLLATVQSGITIDAGRSIDNAVEVPYLRVANVQAGSLDLTEIKTVSVTSAIRQRFLLHDGDVLMTEGGDLDKLGRGTVWRSEVPNAIHQNHVFAVRPKPAVLQPEYLAYASATSLARSYFESTGNRTTNLASTSATKVLDFLVPVRPLAEQAALVAELRRSSTQGAALRGQISESIRRFEELKRSLITAAVTGEFDVSSADGSRVPA